MPSSTKPTNSVPLARGTYAPPRSSDLRSPCPVVNTLANHGYIPRDGRSVRASELASALKELGVSFGVGQFLAKPPFLERQGSTSMSKSLLTVFGLLWYLLWNPWGLFFSLFGVREPGQQDSMGYQVINLDQLSHHGAIEHDVSLTRKDTIEGDNHTPQPEFIKQLLDSSSDGGKTLTAADLAGHRRRRIEKQRQVNPGMLYGNTQHTFACSEIALLLCAFGDDHKVRSDYASAIFKEERLPIEEGWTKRWLWSIGFLEIGTATLKVKSLVGLNIS